MSVCHIIRREIFSPSILIRPASRVLLHTDSSTPSSRQPTTYSIVRSRIIASMPKDTRKSQTHRHTPIQERQKMKGPLAANLTPGSSFQDMAAARIAILENAIIHLDMNANEAADTEKKMRHREKKRNAHNAEIRDLKRQLGCGSDDVMDRFTPTNAPTNAPKGSRAVRAPENPGKAGPLQQRLRDMELGQSSGPNSEEDASNERPRRNDNNPNRHPLPDRRRLPDSSQTPRPGWRPGHVDELVVRASSGMPDRAGRRDEIHAPSAESGGVPEPSNAYIRQASLPPHTAPEPQHILVIIDLNGALIHRPDRKTPTLYIARNSTDLFLDYLFSRFQVMVWSAARPNNVDTMCKQLFPGKSRNQLIAEWGRDKMGLSAQDYNMRTQVYKRLETVWNDTNIQACHPLRNYGKKWDQSNTVLIDDSREKGRSHPYNLIKVPEFEGQRESEDVLRKVAEYLDDLLIQKDVSAYMHKYPFRIDEDQG